MIYPNMWNDSLSMPKEFLLGSFLGVFTAGMIIFAILFTIAVYIYHAIAWYEIAKKQKHKKSWLAWIPFANLSLIFELGGFHWAWIFLILIPVFGWIAILVLSIISMWKIFEKENHPGWFSLSLIIPKVGGILYLVAIGIVAWGKNIRKEKVKSGSKKKRR